MIEMKDEEEKNSVVSLTGDKEIDEMIHEMTIANTKRDVGYADVSQLLSDCKYDNIETGAEHKE